MSDSKLIPPITLAKALGVTPATISYWLKNGIIPAEIKEGRVIRFDLARVREVLANRAAKAVTKASSDPSA